MVYHILQEIPDDGRDRASGRPAPQAIGWPRPPDQADRGCLAVARLPRRPSRRAAGELDDLLLAQFDTPDEPLSAYDLCERVGRTGDPVAPAQVYRTLGRLAERGAIHRIESLSAYARSPDPVDIIAICSSCHRVLMQEAPELLALVAGTAAAKGFELRQIVVEVFGRCARCRQAHGAGCPPRQERDPGAPDGGDLPVP